MEPVSPGSDTKQLPLAQPLLAIRPVMRPPLHIALLVGAGHRIARRVVVNERDRDTGTAVQNQQAQPDQENLQQDFDPCVLHVQPTVHEVMLPRASS